MSRTLRDAAREYREAPARLFVEVGRAAIGLALQGEAMAKTNATTFPAVRSGNLRRSIVGKVESAAERVVIALQAGEGTTERYASALEHGATIRPTRGKFLAIPGPGALTASGVPRFPGPRAVPDAQFIPTRGGAAGIWVRKSKGKARGEILFFAVRQSTIRPRRFIGRAIDELGPKAREAMGRAARRALGGE